MRRYFAFIFLLCTLSLAYTQNLYWELPRTITDENIDCRYPTTLSCIPSSNNKKRNPISAIFWEEIDSQNKEIYLNISTTRNGLKWNEAKRFSSPFVYYNEIPEIYSAAINKYGTIVVATLNNSSQISVYTSYNEGDSFEIHTFDNDIGILVGPRIFATKNDGFIIFCTRSYNETFSLLYTSSKDGKNWTEFKEFPFAVENASNPLVPYLASIDNGDMLVLQAHYISDSRLTFQIYTAFTNDNGQNWTEAKIIKTSEDFDSYNNQHPMILQYQKKIYMIWERSSYASSQTSIYASQISASGEIKGKIEALNQNGEYNNPLLFIYNDQLYALWSDSKGSRNNVYMTHKLSSFWDEAKVIIQNTATSTYPVISANGKELSFIWQQHTEDKVNAYQIAILEKDSSCPPPIIEGLDFNNGDFGHSSELRAKLVETEDSSGIMGFSCIWTRDINEEPINEISNMLQESNISKIADEDGIWYLKAKQVDFAGNWSQSTTFAYTRDTVSPEVPILTGLDDIEDLDKLGLVKSNTFKLQWNSEDDNIGGYEWKLEYLDSIPLSLAENKRHPLKISKGYAQKLIDEIKEKYAEDLENLQPENTEEEKKQKEIRFNNARNGVYAFVLRTLDKAGNKSPYIRTLFILNKYDPITSITSIKSQINKFGDLSLSIIGQNFTYDGTISEIYIDKDKEEPYDYILSTQNGDYVIKSNNRIEDITLQNIEAGNYYIGLLHSDRGLYFTDKSELKIQEHGTVKTFTKFTFIPEWNFLRKDYSMGKRLSYISIILVSLFTLWIFIVACRGLYKATEQSITTQAEIKMITKGNIMKRKDVGSKKLNHSGISLRVKLMAYTMAIILIIVSTLVTVLSYIMINREESTMVKSLLERTNVILDSMSNGAKNNLPNASSNLLALSDLTEESQALSDAEFAIITGKSSSAQDNNIDYIWASNAPDITQKINTEALILGESRFISEEALAATKNYSILEEMAKQEVGKTALQIDELTEEGLFLARQSTNRNSPQAKKNSERLQEITEITTQLNKRLDSILDQIATENTGSYPPFNNTKIDLENTTYLFYRPVLYHHSGENSYVHGVVFIQISTQALINQMNEARAAILKTTIAIIILAFIIGLLSATAMSALIVSPINKLARHVAMIRDTEDKEALAGKDISIHSHDEIGMLGDTVNEMTHGLVDAALQAKNLTVGKEVQTKFIPLQTDERGITLTTGAMQDNGIEFFGYYAGADELSGDYFDYKKLDDDHYAIIKCDVSGHGVPAALIMVEVATLFLNSFNGWSMSNPAQGTNLGPVVGQINNLLESRGFNGRFAAFTLVLINTKTGECWFCNAGDNIVQIYDGASHKKKIISLPETPAAGMFSTDLVDIKGGYKVQKLKLKKDDVLFLYTDGIEESKRNIRTSDGNIIVDASEEMSGERVKDIIEAVYNKDTYVLNKQGDNEVLNFDFSTCEGNAEDAIMALVSIEKIFRLYRPLSPKHSDRIRVDKKIDNFLRLHFKEYSIYCKDHSSIEMDPVHIFYNGVTEDAQYDDLTLVAIKKK